MLLRNLNFAKGQCNGTRYLSLKLHLKPASWKLFNYRAIIRQMLPNCLEIELISGSNIGNIKSIPIYFYYVFSSKGKRIFISRVTLTTKGTEMPLILQRHQFPIKLAFCMSIDKSQGNIFLGIFIK
jgi:hypothetical protein